MEEKKGVRRSFPKAALTMAPLYLFTLVFVAGPLVYMFVLSFLTRAESWGVVGEFTLQNYADIFEPVYLETFWESIKLALLSTVIIAAVGYPFGYFMAKLPPKWKKRAMLLLMIPSGPAPSSGCTGGSSSSGPTACWTPPSWGCTSPRSP